MSAVTRMCVFKNQSMALQRVANIAFLRSNHWIQRNNLIRKYSNNSSNQRVESEEREGLLLVQRRSVNIHGFLRPFSLQTARRGFSCCTLSHRKLLFNKPNLFPVAITSSRSFSSSKQDYYERLGVANTATANEIKHAYYRAAKACHPDLFPDDPKASTKFREVSEAFETLSDPVKRSNYDAARARGNYYAETEAQDHQYTDTQAREAFEGLFHDVSIVLEALGYYIVRTKDDVADAASLTVNGNWTGLWELIKSRPYVFGSFIPLLLVLRFPQLAIGAGVAGGSVALRVVSQILLRNPHHAMDIGSTVWKQIVELAHKERDRELRKQSRGRRK